MALLTPPNPTEEVAQPALMASKSNRRRPAPEDLHLAGGRAPPPKPAFVVSAALGVAGLPAEEIGPAAALQDPPTGTGTVPSSAGCCCKAAATCDPTASSFGQHQTTSGCRHAISTTQPATRGCGMRWDSAARRPKPARGSAPRSKEAGGDPPAGQRAAATPRHGALPRRPDRGDTRVGAACGGGSARAAEVTGRVEQAARHMADRPDVDDRDFRRALDLWLRTTDRAARRLDDNPDAPLPPDEVYALEAVVRADGTRPSLLVRNGVVDPVQPLAAGWTGQLTAAGDELTRAVAAIGRVEPKHPSGSDFFGTCWVVDHRNGLALTNRHVLDAMVERLPHAVARTTTGFRVFDGAFVDFAAESGSADVRRYRIVEATPSEVNGTNFARLDAAVLRIEPLPDGPQDVPDALTVSADPDGPLGRLASYCIVGYPAQPVYESGTIEGVDWAWVTRTLFGNVYGVKRLAPGMTHRPLGSLPGDKRRWVFGHDATTLGGNSGSPALAWTDSAFGLHFAGRSIDTNCAHAVSAITTELRALGVPIGGLG